jgi:hypothetical protein
MRTIGRYNPLIHYTNCKYAVPGNYAPAMVEETRNHEEGGSFTH